MKGLLIIDRIDYKKNNKVYEEVLKNKFSELSIIYTKYEDKIIRFSRKFPKIGNVLMHFLRWLKSLIYTLKIKLNKKKYDEIICLNPIVGILLGIFSKKNKKYKLIVCGFLFEEKSNQFYYKMRIKFTKIALRRIDKVVVYGSKEVTYYEEIFKFKDKFIYIPYGIDFNHSNKYEGYLPNKYIFSGGGSNRDYKTLIDAINLYDNSTPNFVIATQLWGVKDLNLQNVTLLTDVVNETFGDVLKKSELLILSLKDTTISAGHMVMLQAMSLKVPVLVNKIPAICDYVDESMVEFYDSGDSSMLYKKINEYNTSSEKFKKAEKAYKVYNENYNSKSLIQRLLEI